MPATPTAVCSFVSQLSATSGRYAGKPLTLHDFQRAWIDLIFEQDENGDRIRREVLLGIGRKNGKTELTAAIALALLTIEGEPGGLVIGAAAKREQAKLMLNAAKRMVWNSTIDGEPLSNWIEVRRDHLYFPELDSYYKVIAADAQKEHGLNPHAFIVDEAHATLETSRELYDTLLTAQGARENPVGIAITTAGPVPAGPCYDMYVYGRENNQARDAGKDYDRSFGMIWYEAPEECEVDDPDAWLAANPALGKFLNTRFLADQAKAVKTGRMPEFMFRRLHLNQWTTASERWLPISKWQACSAKPEVPDESQIWIALDAAISRDTFGLAVVRCEEDVPFEREDGLIDIRDVAHVLTRRFIPRDGEDYIDPVEVETYILGLAQRFEIVKIGYDPAYMGMLASALADRGFPVEPFPQSAERMTKATETLQRLVLDERVRHGGDKTLGRHMASVATSPTERGVRITKKNQRMPNDLAIALAMALDLAFDNEDDNEIDDFAEFIE